MPRGDRIALWVLVFLGMGTVILAVSMVGEGWFTEITGVDGGLGSRAEASSNKPVLSSLTLSAGTLTPAFVGTQVEYTVPDVPYGAGVLTITAIPEPDATVTYWHYPGGSIAELIDEDTMTDGLQVSLDVGLKIVEVSVTKGSRYRDYRLVITRLKPTVSIRSVSDAPVYEGETIEFEIRRSAAAQDSLAVRVLTTEVEAEVGAGHADVLADDIDGSSTLYYIEGGEATATVEVQTTGDAVWEGHSRVQMSIVADDFYTVESSANSAEIVVQDDEFPASTGVLTVSPNPVGEGQGKTTATVTVTTTENKKPHGEAFVAVETSDGTAEDGSDYAGVDTTVSFAEGDFSPVMVGEDARYRARKTIDVAVSQDTADEDDETFSISASTESGAPISVGEDDSTVVVTITDDDESELMAPTLTSLTVDAGALTPAFSSNVLSYAVPDIGYEKDRLTIAADAESGTSIAFLDSSGNTLADMDDMTTGHQVALGLGVTVVKIRVTRGDDSQDYSLSVTRAKPVVNVRALTTDPAVEGDKIKFEVARSASAGDSLVVNFTLDEVGSSTDFGPGEILPDSQEGTTKSVTITADEITATVEVATTPDAVWENHSRIQMEIAVDDSYIIHGTDGSASVLVEDDDLPDSAATLTVSPNPVREGAGEAVATVTLITSEDRAPHGRVSIPISTSGGTATAGEDYTVVDSSLVFMEEDFSKVEENGDAFYRSSKSVEIAILGDSLDEVDETFNVELGTPSRSAVGIDSGAGSVSVTINDQNSRPEVTVSTAPDPPVVLGRGSVTLDGTATDSDNDTLTYAWTTSPAGIGMFSAAASEDTTWTAPAPLSAEQAVTLTLTVMDDGVPMEVAAADVEVTVRANQAPTVEVTTEGGVVKGGETVTLGTRVSDPEDGVMRYQWSGGGSFGDAGAKDAAWTAPDSTDSMQSFTLMLTATDELGLTASDSVVFTLPAANQEPTFPDSEGGERGVNEDAGVGARVGAPVTATDGDNDTLAYLLGGEDATSFDIDGTGQISVGAGMMLDYEVKREYAVEVSVSDSRNGAREIDNGVDASLPVKISVGDVEEAGVVVFSSHALRVGEEVRVGVQDPDNYNPSNTAGAVADADVTSWLWERSGSVDGPWTEITGPTTATYVPTVEDEDKYLKVTASYTDRRGPDKRATGVWGRVGAEVEEISPLHVTVSPEVATVNGCTVITLHAITGYTGIDVLSYSWSAHPNVGHFDDGRMESTTWSAPVAGETDVAVVLTLTVTEGGGMSATDSVLVTVRGEAAGTGLGE